MKIDLITKRCAIKLFTPKYSSMLLDYHTRNKHHLTPWEPQKEDEFYTLEYWHEQAKISQQLFNDLQAIKFIALNPRETKILAICHYNNIVWGCFKACHLGFSIDKDHEGTGLMFEILTTTITFIKDHIKLHRIMANHLPHNTRSERLLKHLGFEKEGYGKSYLKINGQWQDHILNALVFNDA